VAGLAEVERPEAPAVLEDRDQHAERRAGGEQVHHRGDGGHQQPAEGQHDQQEPEADDDCDEQRELSTWGPARTALSTCQISWTRR
jgi:hypothetical protein